MRQLHTNPATDFSRALDTIDGNAAMRLAKQAIDASPETFDYAHAHHEAFALAFILAHEGRPITSAEIDKLSAELAAGVDNINDPYIDMYSAAWDHGRRVFKMNPRANPIKCRYCGLQFKDKRGEAAWQKLADHVAEAHHDGKKMTLAEGRAEERYLAAASSRKNPFGRR